MSSRWQAFKARRQYLRDGSEMRAGAAAKGDRRRSFDGLGMLPMSEVGATVAPVRILNPDGSLREVVSAEAFRARRSPAENVARKLRRQRGRGVDPVVWRRQRGEGPEGREVGLVP